MKTTTGTILIIISLFFIISNGIIFYKSFIKKECTSSVGAFIGGITGAVGILLLADRKYYPFCIIPLIIDWGSLPLIIRFIFLLIKDKR